MIKLTGEDTSWAGVVATLRRDEARNVENSDPREKERERACSARRTLKFTRYS